MQRPSTSRDRRPEEERYGRHWLRAPQARRARYADDSSCSRGTRGSNRCRSVALHHLSAGEYRHHDRAPRGSRPSRRISGRDHLRVRRIARAGGPGDNRCDPPRRRRIVAEASGRRAGPVARRACRLARRGRDGERGAVCVLSSAGGGHSASCRGLNAGRADLGRARLLRCREGLQWRECGLSSRVVRFRHREHRRCHHGWRRHGDGVGLSARPLDHLVRPRGAGACHISPSRCFPLARFQATASGLRRLLAARTRRPCRDGRRLDRQMAALVLGLGRAARHRSPPRTAL